jgi:uncharacterized C2H2 Zn-finger protein
MLIADVPKETNAANGGVDDANAPPPTAEAAASTSSGVVFNCMPPPPAPRKKTKSVATVVFKCTICDAKLRTWQDKFVHLSERISPCGMSFRCRSLYNRHVRIFGCFSPRDALQPQPDDGGTLCVFCDLNLESQAALYQHSLLSKCPRCGYLHRCQTQMELHVSVCRFAPPQDHSLLCVKCGKLFHSTAFLDTHLYAQHSDAN